MEPRLPPSVECIPRQIHLDRWTSAAAKAIFTRVVHFNAPPGDLANIKRTPVNTLDPAAVPLSFWSRKLNRPVACESGAELRVFLWLENSPQVRWYQEQPAALRYSFEGRAGAYYPDVAVLDRSGRLIVVEVKPLYMMYRHEAVAKATAALEHFGPRGIGYLLVDPRGRTLGDFIDTDYDREVAEAVESLFVHGPVPFRLVRNLLRMRCGRYELAAFASMAIKRNWSVTSGPPVRIWKLPDELSLLRLCGALPPRSEA